MALSKNIRFKADDLWDTPEDGNRYEIIDGALFVTPPPLEPHQHASMVLSGYLWPYIQARRLGRLYAALFGVVLDAETAVQPDLVFVSEARRGLLTERGLEGTPDLVIEILSRSTQARDRGIKMRRYAAAGVPNYWIVDPRSRVLEVYELAEQGYALSGTFGPGGTLRPALFPDLAIPIDVLWS